MQVEVRMRPPVRLSSRAEFGDHLQVGLQIEQLGKTGSDDLVIVDEGNFYHDVSLKFGTS